ncbi:MAG: hypothetical protein U0169_27095 [Polyangiaceae bacterium]
MNPNVAVSASSPGILDAALAAFPAGNAADAVARAIFAHAGADPSVLLGPVQILVGGTGAGLRAIDGRSRQPGLGADRPRGFVDGEKIPDAAFVAVPALPGALAILVASFGSSTFAQAASAATERAKGLSKERHAFFTTFARRGPSYLSDATIADELVASAGKIAGGLLTKEDLDAVRPEVTTARTTVRAPRSFASVPWGFETVSGDDAPAPLDASRVEIVAATDVFGLVVIAAYEVGREGLSVDALGLVAPRGAEPVRRGTPRVRPGDVRPSAAPIALGSVAGVWDLGLGVVGCGDAERRLASLLTAVAARPTLEEAIHAPRSAAEGDGSEASPMVRDVGRAYGVLRGSQSARPLSDRRALVG